MASSVLLVTRLTDSICEKKSLAPIGGYSQIESVSLMTSKTEEA